MPFAKRRRALVCFYCGSRSSCEAGTVRRFKCDHCDAENYLDENGQITDPPAHDSPHVTSAVRYARSPQRSPSPSAASDFNDIFCKTCLKNQYLLKETLASYLPPDDDPQYDQFLDSYDTYRQKLERRYPPICNRCAPKARERIKKSAYLAKTDHLRRLMDRTRHTGYYDTRGGFLFSLLVRAAGACYLGSAILQACWHLFAVMTIQHDRTPADENHPLENPHVVKLNSWHLTSCLHSFYTSGILDASCSTQLDNWMLKLLIVAVLTIWWNPQFWNRFIRSGGKMAHLLEYYMMQIMLLGSRTIAVRFISLSNPKLHGDALKGAHLFMVLLLIALLFISARVIRLQPGSTVSFQLAETAVLPDIPSTAETPARMAQTPAAKDSQQPFPIHLLTSPTAISSTPHRTPSNSRTEVDDDPNAMDWTPTNKSSFSSFNRPIRTSNSSFTTVAQLGPSPFHGTLPAAPLPPAHRLRKLPELAPGAFRKATEMQKNQFSQNLMKAPSTGASPSSHRHLGGEDDSYETDTTATETDDERNNRKRVRTGRSEMDMANPKFWPQSDLDSKTGLEDIFEEGFTIRDTPVEVSRRVQKGSVDVGNQRGGNEVKLSRENRWGGFGDVHDSEGAATDQATKTDGWTTILTVGLVPAFCLGIAIAVVKGGLL